jgi:hypothetical protein
MVPHGATDEYRGFSFAAASCIVSTSARSKSSAQRPPNHQGQAPATWSAAGRKETVACPTPTEHSPARTAVNRSLFRRTIKSSLPPRGTPNRSAARLVDRRARPNEEEAAAAEAAATAHGSSSPLPAATVERTPRCRSGPGATDRSIAPSASHSSEPRAASSPSSGKQRSMANRPPGGSSPRSGIFPSLREARYSCALLLIG